MALIIENGSIVAGANSYVTAAEARAFATARGITLDASDAVVEAQLVRAMDYLEAQRASYQGYKTDPETQELQWPRTGVVIDCKYSVPENSIPKELKHAQMLLVLEDFAGIVFMPSSDGRVVKREKLDVIEREFAVPNDMKMTGLPTASMPAVDAALAPLFAPCGGGPFSLRTVRV